MKKQIVLNLCLAIFDALMIFVYLSFSPVFSAAKNPCGAFSGTICNLYYAVFVCFVLGLSTFLSLHMNKERPMQLFMMKICIAVGLAVTVILVSNLALGL